MSSKTITALTGATLTLVIAAVAAVGLAGGGLVAAACTAPTTPPPSTSDASTDIDLPTVDTWDREQITNAATCALNCKYQRTEIFNYLK